MHTNRVENKFGREVKIFQRGSCISKHICSGGPKEEEGGLK